jgi:hypothetical protein
MPRVCIKCSTQNEDSAAYCDYCGEVLPQAVPPFGQGPRPAPVPPPFPGQRPPPIASMLACGACGQAVPTGDIFCSNCGTPVSSAKAVPPAATPYISRAAPVPPPAPSPETALMSDIAPHMEPTPDAATRVLKTGRLVIGNAEIQLPPQPEVTLGRQDPYAKPPWHPDVDLTAYGAGDPAYGVSRRHARLVWAGEWTIEDLNSANGTFVSGQRIEQRTPLRDGDQIMLGCLVLTFRTS